MKKKNVQDATLKNIRVLKKDVALIKKRHVKLEFEFETWKNFFKTLIREMKK